MNTTLKVIDSSGSDIGTVEVAENLLEREKGDQAVKDCVVAFQAARRAGTGSAKNRSQITGTGAKPYRQKGTGRARAGTVKSPLWRGGGVIFGPKPRSFAKATNRKVRQLAVRRAFTERVDAGDVIVLDRIVLAEPKTRLMAALLKAVGAGDRALVLVDELTGPEVVAARNIPGVEVMSARSVNAYWLLAFRKVVVTQAALTALTERLTTGESVEE